MSFRFKLQRALDYREQLEEEAKIRLAQATQNHNVAEQRKNALDKELRCAEQNAREHPLMSMGEFWITDQYLKGLREDLQNAVMEEKLAAQVKKEALQLLTARAIDKKLLVKLKEQQQKVWTKQELLKEQHFNDEIATTRYQASVF